LSSFVEKLLAEHAADAVTRQIPNNRCDDRHGAGLHPIDASLPGQRAGESHRQSVGQRQSDRTEQHDESKRGVPVNEHPSQNLIRDRGEPSGTRIALVRGPRRVFGNHTLNPLYELRR
jgi:hypothetical protein